MTTWDTFFNDKCKEIFTTSKLVLDIGEGLRARSDRGSAFDPERVWLQEYIAKVDYKVLDPVPDYKPDIIGDIHALPFEDNSVDAILCLAVLEHVTNPFLAMQEMYRVLKPGGKMLMYVPFLYYYHNHAGYCNDYWRYTHEGILELAKDFGTKELCPVRQRFETFMHLSPLARFRNVMKLARVVDDWFPKENGHQVAGYNVYLVK